MDHHTLLVGGIARPGCDHVPLSQCDKRLTPGILEACRADGRTSGHGTLSGYAEIVLQIPLSYLTNVHQVFSDLDTLIQKDGILTVTGSGLPTWAVETLVRLGGFDPVHTSGSSNPVVRCRRQRIGADGARCTVVIPCRNEVGNIAELVRRVPELGARTQLLFVDGASTDGTPERIRQAIRESPQRDIALLTQTGGGGKAAAVFQGFDAAEGDILLILDADMTVAPEDLPLFVVALTSGLADFANGSRFAYPMETGAMPPANIVGNRTFSLVVSWLLGARVTDTLCGTKVLYKRDWERIREVKGQFGGHDVWGDFDLLLGAASLGLRVLDIPVRYGARREGESKMQPLRHGVSMARTCLAGVRVLKLNSTGARLRRIAR